MSVCAQKCKNTEHDKILQKNHERRQEFGKIKGQNKKKAVVVDKRHRQERNAQTAVIPNSIKTEMQTQSHEPESTSESDIIDYLNDLENHVTYILPKRIDSLKILRDSMISQEGQKCFDKEDLEAVNNELTKLSKELESQMGEWKHKSHLYNNTLAEMEHMLNCREQILNDVDTQTELFTLHPNITHLFAAKQAELLMAVGVLRQQLHETWQKNK